jgi:hypothetical protein
MPVTCQILPADFAGNYIYNTDTIKISFLKSNCPANDSNIYTVKGLGELMNTLAKPGYTFEISDVNLRVKEQNKRGSGVKKYVFNVELTPLFIRLNTTGIYGSYDGVLIFKQK